MNWEAVGAIAESVGAMGVLATLVYLAVQIRHSRTLMEHNHKLGLSQMYQARASEGMENQRFIAEGDHLAPILARLNNGITFSELNSEEQRRIQALGQMRALHLDNLFYQYELGLLDEFQADRYRENVRLFYPTWVESGVFVTPRLQAVHDKLREPGT